MKLSEIANNLEKFTGNKLINYIETNIETAIKKTILQNQEYYWNKEYTKPFLDN